MSETNDYAAFVQQVQANCHLFLLRTCRGDSDDEISVQEIAVPGNVYADRTQEGRFAAYEAICHLVDEAVVADVEKHGEQITDFLISKITPGRYVYYADGVAVANIHVCVGEPIEKAAITSALDD